MCSLSNAIREKPNWWEKIQDLALVEKWKKEALDQQADEYRIWRLTERMVLDEVVFQWHPSDPVQRSTTFSRSCMVTRLFGILRLESR